MESNAPTVLTSFPGFVQFYIAKMGTGVYSTAVSAVVPDDAFGVEVSGFRCGGCRLPVTGDIGSLLLYEELHGVFAGGGPKIVYLGQAPDEMFDGQMHTMIYFELVPQGNDIDSGPQFGGPYFDTPSVHIQVHPPTGSDTLTGTESGVELTVVAAYQHNSVSCPLWNLADSAMPSMFPKGNEPRSLLAFWPLRRPPTVDTARTARSEGQNVFTGNYTFPIKWLGFGGSAFLPTGIMGVQIDNDIDKWALTYGAMQHLEDKFAPADRLGTGAILALATGDFSSVWSVDSDTIFGVATRIPAGETYFALFYSFEDGSFAWRERVMFPRLAGNQMQLD